MSAPKGRMIRDNGVSWYLHYGTSYEFLGTGIDDAVDDARRVFWPEAPFMEWDEIEEARKAGMPM